MLIKQIELENIKTHKNTVIPFKKGLNVLHGDNGTGKSSILEMIGFVLFDFLKSSKHQIYVRDVHKDRPEYGTVRISIIGSNNEPFIIERTIGKTSVAVYNGLTKKKLNIETVSKLKNWIKKQLGLKQEVDLGTLFDTAIGIPQGMIVTNFLDRPKDRKAYFDRILQLEIYEKVWENLGQLRSKVKSSLADLQGEIGEFRGEIKDKQGLILRKQEFVEEIEKKSTKLKEKKLKAVEIKKELENLRILKKRLEEAKNLSSKLKISEEIEEKNLKNLRKQLDESIKARKNCDDTKELHEKYLSRSKEYDSLIDKNNILIEKKDDLSKILEEYNKIKSKFDRIKQGIADAEKSREKSKNLEPKYQEYKKLEIDTKNNDEELAKIVTLEENFKKNQANQSKLNSILSTLKLSLKVLPNWQEKSDECVLLEKDKSDLEIEILILKNEISYYKNNQKKIENTICPFSDQKCKNIKEGSFDVSYFSREIENKKQLIDTKEKDLRKLKDRLKGKQEIKNKLTQIEKDKVMIKEYERQIYDLQKEIKEIKTEVLRKPELTKNRENFETQKYNLQSDVDDYKYHKKNVETFHELEKSLIPIESEMKKSEQNKEQLDKEVKAMKEVPEVLNKIKQEMDNLMEPHERYQQYIKIAEKIKDRKKEVDDTTTQLSDLKVKQKENLEVINELNSIYDEEEYLQCEIEDREIGKIIVELETQLNSKQEMLDDINDRLEIIEKKETELEALSKKENKLEAQIFFFKKTRFWLREFIPKMRKALMDKINNLASEIYRSIREDEGAALEWKEDYDITISTSKTVKDFFRLSGGEKMSAALSIRLAILKTLTNAEFAFFDEPTSNLDPSSRTNLSKLINNIKGFNQLFVISHDDCFQRNSEYVIKFYKDDTETTKIKFPTL